MDTNTQYKCIKKSSEATYSDRGSRFIAYSSPIEEIEDVKKILKELKDLHPKAAHHCYAYRIGHDGHTYRCSDDGEPAGSAGRPILGQIDSVQLSNVIVIVVRYFGGVLLGVPGLIAAYKTAARMVLDTSGFEIHHKTKMVKLQFVYEELNQVMRILKSNQCIIKQQELGLFCSIQALLPLLHFDHAMQQFKDLRNVEVVSM